MKYAFYFLMPVLLSGCHSGIDNKSDMDNKVFEWNYSDSLDAVIAAPESHEVLLENDEVRVLRVTIKPGQKEPYHTHRWKGVMYVEKPARIRYYNENEQVVYISPEDQPSDIPKGPEWLEPEILHAVENIDSVVYVGLRIELKTGENSE